MKEVLKKKLKYQEKNNFTIYFNTYHFDILFCFCFSFLIPFWIFFSTFFIIFFVFIKPCSDERQNGFKGLKLKHFKFLQPIFTSCEEDCLCFKTLKQFRFKFLRRFLKNRFFWFFKTALRTHKTSFRKLTTSSIDFLLFFH